MAKSSLEKELEKQRKLMQKHQRETKQMENKRLREEKRKASNEAKQQQAYTVVNNQPIRGGMKMMDAVSEEILKIILLQYDGRENRYVTGNYDLFPEAYNVSIEQIFEQLMTYGMIIGWISTIEPEWSCYLTPQGINYFDDKKKALEKEDMEKDAKFTIGSIVANGSNIVFGNATNSTFSIDNSYSEIEKQIEEKGGEDRAELLEIMEEVKDLIANMNETRHIQKNRGLFSRISSHLDKHGWFYAEIVALLGGQALNLLQE